MLCAYDMQNPQTTVTQPFAVSPRHCCTQRRAKAICLYQRGAYPGGIELGGSERAAYAAVPTAKRKLAPPFFVEKTGEGHTAYLPAGLSVHTAPDWQNIRTPAKPQKADAQKRRKRRITSYAETGKSPGNRPPPHQQQPAAESGSSGGIAAARPGSRNPW